MTSKTPRTGNQYSIHYGDYSAVICELGAKIRRFDYQGKEIFCPFGVNDLTPTCNGYALLLGTIYFPTAPFCRLMDYHVEHRGCQLPSVNYFVNQAILHGFPGRHIIIPLSISGNLLNAFPCIVCQDVVQALSAFNHMV